MEVFEAIKIRRSARNFKNLPVSDEIVAELLEAARLAPSGGNAQEHVFGVIKDPIMKSKLAATAGNQMWIASAPVVFACCADVSWDIAAQPADGFGLKVNKLRFGAEFIEYLIQYPDRKACMTLFANATPLIPAEHMVLTAVSHGLSACYIGYLDVAKANEILNLPEHLTCLFLLPVGYANEDAGKKSLKKVEEISFYDQWQE
jgi:nitroreductase